MLPLSDVHSNPVVPTSLSLALKEATAELHTLAETHPVQKRLLSSQATRASYAAFLAQLAALHAVLDRAMRTQATDMSRIASVVRSHHYREAAAWADFNSLEPASELTAPLSPTTDFCRQLEDVATCRPIALLGVLYVLEGATNGGKFIAAALRNSLALPCGTGTTYLDPHGSRQAERWTEFKTTLDQLNLNTDDRDVVISTACKTFKAICNIFDALRQPALVVVSDYRRPRQFDA